MARAATSGSAAPGPEPDPGPGPTRRGLLARAGVAAGTLAAAAALDAAGAAPAARAATGKIAQAPDDDGDLLRKAIALEQLAAFSTAVLLGERRFTGSSLAAARRFHDQQLQHVDVLVSSLEPLGGKAPVAPTSVTVADHALSALPHVRSVAAVRTQTGAIAFEIRLTEALVGGWYGALHDLQDRRLMAVAAQVMANEAQQLAVWRGLVSEVIAAVVPGAFERGSAG